MAVGKEIRTKIRSVQNTQKITRAMEMVAASKMRKVQEQMRAARPYAEKIRTVVSHLAGANPEYKHDFMQQRETTRVGYIVVSTDRGLCGGLNSNLFRMMLGEMKRLEDKDIEAEYCAMGNKASMFLSRMGTKVVAQSTHLGDSPRIDDLIGSVKVMLDAYSEARIDNLFLVYNTFVNSMTQKPGIEQLLPLVASEEEGGRQFPWDYIYEPEAKDILDHLLTRYIESLVYQGVVENTACEQAARMVAMKAASDNAGTLIGELQLMYNKARQAAITQELSEIVAGAAAV